MIAKNRGDQLNDEVTAAREILERTTDRAKEHEQSESYYLCFYNILIHHTNLKQMTFYCLDMQEGYAFMGEKMKEQYELQKLEPGLRCELLQVSLSFCAQFRLLLTYSIEESFTILYYSCRKRWTRRYGIWSYR